MPNRPGSDQRGGGNRHRDHRRRVHVQPASTFAMEDTTPSLFSMQLPPLATRNLTTVLAGNLDFLLRLWIEARTRLRLPLHQLSKTGQYKFTVLFNFFISEVVECIGEHSSGSLGGLGGVMGRNPTSQQRSK
jgi:hypothetical protein